MSAIPVRTIPASVASAELQGGGARIVYAAERGAQREIEEHLPLGPRESLEAVESIGRLLRILRAARRRPPRDPYGLAEQPERVVDLLQGCRGTRLQLQLRRCLDRQLTVWTETGVERIARVVDFHEDAAGLSVQVLGTPTPRRVPRAGLIRYAARAQEYLEVLGVDPLAPRSGR